MSFKQKQLAGIVLLGLAMIFVIFAGFRGIQSSRIKQGTNMEHASQEDTFYSYESVDKRKDGSSMNVSFYKSDDGFIMTQVYKDYGNRCAYRHSVLSEDDVKRLKELVSEPFKASTADESAEFYKKGVVKFRLDGKESSYAIEPLDLSGFAIKDPGTDANLTDDIMHLVGDLPEYCNVFDLTVFESFLGFSDKPQLRAYLDSVYRQIADRLIGSEDSENNLEIGSTMISRILLDHVDEDMYGVLVEFDGEKVPFTIMKSGYVLK